MQHILSQAVFIQELYNNMVNVLLHYHYSKIGHAQ